MHYYKFQNTSRQKGKLRMIYLRINAIWIWLHKLNMLIDKTILNQLFLHESMSSKFMALRIPFLHKVDFIHLFNKHLPLAEDSKTYPNSRVWTTFRNIYSRIWRHTTPLFDMFSNMSNFSVGLIQIRNWSFKISKTTPYHCQITVA